MRCIVGDCTELAHTSSPFCGAHQRAPAWQRAAWTSVHKRKIARAPRVVDAEAHDVYDASNIAPRLWIGARPPLDRSYPGVDLIVLCAAEYQPRSFPHYDKALLNCPIPDDALSKAEQSRVLIAAQAVARELKDGGRVLVTCQQGKNRSALVACLALAQITKATPEQLVDLVRKKRHPNALYNPHFREYLAAFRRR